MSSNATRQGTLSHSRLSSLSHSGLILAKEWNLCVRANLHLKKTKTGREWIVEHSPEFLACEEETTTTSHHHVLVWSVRKRSPLNQSKLLKTAWIPSPLEYFYIIVYMVQTDTFWSLVSLIHFQIVLDFSAQFHTSQHQLQCLRFLA